MGQKVNSNGLRFGINRNWQSRWIASSNYQTSKWLIEDDKIRNYIFSKYNKAEIDSIHIERLQDRIELFIYAVQTGYFFGREGKEEDKLKKEINKIVGRNIKVFFKVIQIENKMLSAKIMAREIADQIEKKISFRNAQKFVIKKVLQSGAIGIKTRVSGRLGGVEMAREEGYSEGITPLSTLRANVDYALEEAHTTYGIIGVKVWINRGTVFGTDLDNKNPITLKQKINRNSKFNDFKNKKSFNRDEPQNILSKTNEKE
ncbi:MAG: 30S ribosomal protein S3 [Mycoplasmoidaceae bacterium]